MTRKSKPSFSRRFKVYITAVIAGFAASGAALLIFSLLSFLMKLPVGYGELFSLLAFAIGCLTAGFFAGAMKRQNGLAAGVKAALLFAAPVALISIILAGLEIGVTEDVSGSTAAFNKIVASVFCGAAGGVFGVNKNRGF
jgi:putative membrane protein (TIGR04086 family)